MFKNILNDITNLNLYSFHHKYLHKEYNNEYLSIKNKYGEIFERRLNLDNKEVSIFNEYDKANPLPHDTEKERIKCQISSDMITSKHKNNKNAIINIANTMSITEAMDGSLLNNKIND